MDLELEGRVVVVTGASAGIGRATVIAFLLSPASAQITGSEYAVDGGALHEI